MRSTLVNSVPAQWRYLVDVGRPRPVSGKLLWWIFGLWLLALTLKLIGSAWDAAWHFRFLRDDLAPPHNINTVGTILAVGLVMFHSWTGLGVSKRSLRLLQAGVGIFLLAIPLDLLNHRIFGLDITAWSGSHALLYFGTACMQIGLLVGWLEQAPQGRSRTAISMVLWTFILENVLFPLCQQEYGIIAYTKYMAGTSTASPDLLALASTAPFYYSLGPTPTWVYPIWLTVAGGLILVAARAVMGLRWTATMVALAYLTYRYVAYGLLVSGDFPESFIPVMVLAGGLAIDLTWRLPLRALLAPLAYVGAIYGTVQLLPEGVLMPDFNPITAPISLALMVGLYGFMQWRPFYDQKTVQEHAQRQVEAYA